MSARWSVALLALTGCPATETPVGSFWLDASLADAGPPPSGLYLEAEEGELSGGFVTGQDSAASASRYLAAPAEGSSDGAPGPARARYVFELSRPGRYVVWGRIRSPRVDANRLWFQLDGGAFVKWRISTGPIWFWDDVHDDLSYGTPLRFELSAGVHELVLASCVPGVALDRLYIGVDGDVPPGNDTPCNPPHSIEVNGACLPSCGSLGGKTCGGPECMGKPQLEAYDCAVCCLDE